MQFVDCCAFVLFLSMNICNACMCIFFILYPNLPNLPGNILPTDKWYWFPLVYIFTIYTNTILLLKCSFLACLALVYGIVYLPFVLNELCLGKTKYRATEHLRHSNNLFVVYRMTQIIQEMVNIIIGKLLFPAQAAVTLAYVFGCCIIIRHKKDLSITALTTIIIWSALPNFLWGTALYIGGYLHSSGRKILKSWKYCKWETRGERKLVLKFAKSCRPLMICYGSFFILRRQSLPMFVKGLIKGLQRGLLVRK